MCSTCVACLPDADPPPGARQSAAISRARFLLLTLQMTCSMVYTMILRFMSKSSSLVPRSALALALLLSACSPWAGWGDSGAKGSGSGAGDDTTQAADSACLDSSDPDCTSALPDTLDLDGDGVSVADGDCDDDNPYVYPGAPESCADDLNSDCDPDGEDFDPDADGCTLFYEDFDKDGYGAATGTPFCACEGQEDNAPSEDYPQQNPVANDDDCDDGDGDHHPGVEPVCDGNLDDDCDGEVDLYTSGGDLAVYLDEDSDQHGIWTDDPCEVGTDPTEDPPSALCLCSMEMPGWPESKMEEVSEPDGSTGRIFPEIGEGYVYVEDSKDCYDDDPDLSCITFYADYDDDGYGDATDSACLCSATPPYLTRNATDCDDTNKHIYPNATESCDSGTPIDSDCDGDTNDRNATGCDIHFRDADGDGYIDYDDFACYCEATADYIEEPPDKEEDCNDNRADIHPDAVDCCGGEDADCDGENPACDPPDTGDTAGTTDTCSSVDDAGSADTSSGGTTP